MRYYSYGIALFIFIVDFITKKWIENNLELYEKINVIGTFFKLRPFAIPVPPSAFWKISAFSF
ncbi:hypothetical protein PACILC2_27290 [Paenibacillus cisolokensis]|uniref:Signal peptidase II n=1 Tax=Paenibacillus cisolokensis TaxID=1658519 RepID=A0ABQ4N7J1_9BACL|nr:hypothetical protein PACILC2_27290 [Paenibacillus cisolokensis]